MGGNVKLVKFEYPHYGNLHVFLFLKCKKKTSFLKKRYITPTLKKAICIEKKLLSTVTYFFLIWHRKFEDENIICKKKYTEVKNRRNVYVNFNYNGCKWSDYTCDLKFTYRGSAYYDYYIKITHSNSNCKRSDYTVMLNSRTSA